MKDRKDKSANFEASSSSELKSIHEWQEKLVSAPLRAVSYAGGRYILDIAVCSVQVGYELLQTQPTSTTNPVEY